MGLVLFFVICFMAGALVITVKQCNALTKRVKSLEHQSEIHDEGICKLIDVVACRYYHYFEKLGVIDSDENE